MLEPVDLLMLGGTVVTMDDAGTIIPDGGVAVRDGRIVAVAPSAALRGRYSAAEVIETGRQVIMPGLVDTYGHAGHGLIRAIYHPRRGWPAGSLYWHETTPDWWYAEAQLAAVERLRFGVTTGASVIGSTPARTDDPVFAERNAEAYARVGIRAVLGVGPPDPFIPHIPAPFSGSFFEDGRRVTRLFSYDEALANALLVAERWHGAADGRIRVALAPAYLFGRHVFHQDRFVYAYQPGDEAVVLAKAEELRALADAHGLQIHTHMFRGSVSFALRHFGRPTVERLLGPDVLVQHANGLEPEEVAVIGAAGCSVACAPSTTENLWYGYAPVVELLEAGANVTIATDGSAPRFSFDLWKDISRAMWHQWIAHRSQEVMPPGKALRMVTIDAARALGLGDELGSLEAGKQADIIAVDLDRPHLTPQAFLPQLLTYYVNGNDVTTAIVGGRTLMRDGKILSVDVDAVLGLAREEAAKVFERVDLAPYMELGRDFWHGARY